jgi:hypothetical protein
MSVNRFADASISEIIVTLNNMLRTCVATECVFTSAEDFINSWYPKDVCDDIMLRKYGYTDVEDPADAFRKDLCDAIANNYHVKFDYNPFADSFKFKPLHKWN